MFFFSYNSSKDPFTQAMFVAKVNAVFVVLNLQPAAAILWRFFFNLSVQNVKRVYFVNKSCMPAQK